MSILIIGAQGRVGSSLVSYFQAQGEEVIPWTRQEITMEDEVLCQKALESIPAEVTCLINAAAIGSIEACTADPLTAHFVNARSPELMAEYCRGKGIRFIHFSTDYVLEGDRKGLKNEQTKCQPINTYGECKLEGEERVLSAYPEAIIARVAWVFGNKEKPSFPDMIRQKILALNPLEAIADKWSLPTSMTTVCRAIHFLAHHAEVQGIIHVCNSGEPISWFDYAQEILHYYQEKKRVSQDTEIQPMSFKQSTVQTDRRPIHSALDNSRLASLMGEIPSWKEDLRLYLESLD